MKRASLVALALLAALPAAKAAGPTPDIRIVYDNTSARPEMKANWGFAAVIDVNGHRLLFDSGMRPDILAENLKALAIEPASIEQAILSHVHGDHAAGITAITENRPELEVHRPASGEAPFQLLPGVYSTGMIRGTPPEQALVIETAKGLVILTGCSHPGIARMVETARAQRGNKPVRLLVGGFHMLNDKPDQVAATITKLRELQVAAIVPTHCTGVEAIRQFREAFGPGFQEGGAGRRITIPD